MGPPKNRWTETEEAAFKAGMAKHGIGKWSEILKDPEFKIVLSSRTNVNLKDKWRNMNMMASGSGSQYKASTLSKNNQKTSNDDGNSVAPGMVTKNDTEALPLAVYGETPEETSSKTQISRLDDLILEAITKLKEPHGSNRAAIMQYIVECQLAPPDFEKKLAANLKILTEAGRLVKVKRLYKIASSSMSLDVGKDPSPLLQGETHKVSSEVYINKFRMLTRAEVDAELEAMMRMTTQKAAAAAERAVEEAEAAIAAAEEAEREAKEAEAKAEAAWCVAEEEMKSFKHKNVHARIPGGKYARAFF